MSTVRQRSTHATEVPAMLPTAVSAGAPGTAGGGGGAACAALMMAVMSLSSSSYVSRARGDASAPGEGGLNTSARRPSTEHSSACAAAPFDFIAACAMS
eukprot:631822-Prorocentrum_minimum.AAC.3